MSHAATIAAWEIKGLSSTQKLVLLCLAQHAGADGRCWPSLALVAAESCLSPRAAWQGLQDLGKAGLIRIEARGRNQSNVYILTLDAQLARPAIAPDAKVAADAIAPSASIASSAEGLRTSCYRASHVVPTEVAPRANEPVIEPVKEPVKRKENPFLSTDQKAEPINALSALAALVQGIDPAQDPERDGWQQAWAALQCRSRSLTTTGLPANVENGWFGVWREHLAKVATPPTVDDMRKFGRWWKAGGASETRKAWFAQLGDVGRMVDWFARSQAWDEKSPVNAKASTPTPRFGPPPPEEADRINRERRAADEEATRIARAAADERLRIAARPGTEQERLAIEAMLNATRPTGEGA